MYRFAAGHEFDSENGEVRGSHTTARLEPQPAALLTLLAERAGTLVTYEQITRRIWGDDTHVNFRQNIHYGIRQVRNALGDTARPSRVIESIPRRGYRLRSDALVPGTRVEVAIPDPPNKAEPKLRQFREIVTLRRAIAAASLTALIVITLLIERRPNDHHEITVRVLKAVHDLVY